ncbi:lipocalin-like domain-containing protein [Variovorax sp. J22R24]|uniref:lipocalin-like domain-containing protein n=1 Tax=Variovorax gracilis TaxID=3053502 RepID=UPI0025770424|nr:lipocalin-like domain-containing protein [Variovorax sp. J22R24]MDM0108545.1 lipocalin-like domain-containing protein [Variovorax sp. J22R24]
MNTHTRLPGCIVSLGFLLFLPHAAIAKDKATQPSGVWAVSSIVIREVDSGAIRNLLGEKPVGHAIFTRGGHFVWGWVGDGRKSPAGPVATDDERVALYQSLAFGTGSYRVEGSSVFLRYASSWNQIWTGTERKAEMQVSGKTLTWKSPPYKLPDGKDAISVITLERKE